MSPRGGAIYPDGRKALTAIEIETIARLADERPGIKSGEVARLLERDAGTIHWHMMQRGMLTKTLRYGRSEPYWRGEKKIYPWTRPEDLRAQALRVEGLIPREIAEIMVKEFGKPRSPHGVDVRLKMLAAYENTPEEIEA